VKKIRATAAPCGLVEHGAGMNPHGRRTEFLASLAVLFGCAQEAGGEFPDGARPDVTRLNVRKAVFFIGEAKDTESPGNTETQLRLLSYLKWIRAYVEAPHRTAVIAICFGQQNHTSGWIRTLRFLGREAGVIFLEEGVERFDGSTRVVWHVYGSGGNDRTP
jgi:hypothetical protein